MAHGEVSSVGNELLIDLWWDEPPNTRGVGKRFTFLW